MIDDKSKFCKRERERESERKKERERERKNFHRKQSSVRKKHRFHNKSTRYRYRYQALIEFHFTKTTNYKNYELQLTTKLNFATRSTQT